MTVLRPLLPDFYRSSGFLSLLLTLLLLPNLTLAQPDVDADKIVFEPSLIPDSEEEARSLYSFNSSGGLPEIQESSNLAVSAADRLRIGEVINAYVDAVGDMELEEGPFPMISSKTCSQPGYWLSKLKTIRGRWIFLPELCALAELTMA